RVAEEAPHERARPAPERVEDADAVLLPRPRDGRPGRAAEEAEVDADRPKTLGEQRDDGLPQPRVAEPAVQKQDGLAAADLVVPEARTVDVDYRHGPTLVHASASYGHPPRTPRHPSRSPPSTRS